MAINRLLAPGVAMSNVDMMPIRAYARAQNGRASGSLQQHMHVSTSLAADLATLARQQC